MIRRWIPSPPLSAALFVAFRQSLGARGGGELLAAD